MSQMIFSGSRAGDLGDEVARALAGELGRRSSAADLLHVVLDLLDHPRGEPGRDDPAQPGVPGVVHVDHRAEELEELDRHVDDARGARRPEQNTSGLPAGLDDVRVPDYRVVAAARADQSGSGSVKYGGSCRASEAGRSRHGASPATAPRNRSRTGRCRRRLAGGSVSSRAGAFRLGLRRFPSWHTGGLAATRCCPEAMLVSWIARTPSPVLCPITLPACVIRASCWLRPPTAGLDAPVPSCPGWLVRDLLGHLGFVHRWAAGHVTGRSDQALAALRSEELLGLAPADESLPGWFRQGHAALVRALQDAPPELDCWTFPCRAIAPGVLGPQAGA